jgi:hypothetical protein
MKRLIRIALIVFTLTVIIIATPQLILSYPVFLFHEKLTHNNFTVLSDQPIDSTVTAVLDSIAGALSATGFYKNETSLTIILCKGEGKANFLDKISMVSPGAGFHHFTGNIYLFPVRIQQFRRENEKVTGEERELLKGSYLAFNFEDILTHEILHKLHADTMGIWQFRRKLPPPHWKAEGFAEYYAHGFYNSVDPETSFVYRLSLYEKYKNRFPLFYLKSELMYEYMVRYKHMSFEDIMQDEVKGDMVYAEMCKNDGY